MGRPRIGILTHFGSFQDGYALAVGWRERARLLEYMDQDFELLVDERCPEGCYPGQRNCLTSIPKDEPFERRARHFQDLYERTLAPYDIVLTADILYQSKGNFLAYNQGLRSAQATFIEQGRRKAFCHWVHSAYNNHKSAPYPESLRYTPMPDSVMVYMNDCEKSGLARMYGIPEDCVQVVYNPKDFRSFHNFHPLAWKICRTLDIPNKDIVQVFPHCTTRADAKGAREVIRAIAACKRQGAKVALILANANARRMSFEIHRKKELCEEVGLVEGEDYLYTSDIIDQKGPLPRAAVANLFLVSNVFVFGSWREVCPNVLLEAKISGNLLVVSQDLAPGVEFAGPRAIYFRSSAKKPGIPDGPGDMRRVRQTDKDWDDLARTIIDKAPSREHLWDFSFERIWEDQFSPLLNKAMEVVNG